MSNPNTNKLCLWRDSILYLGDSFSPQLHSHHAVQCCIALNGKLRIRWTGVDSWQVCTMAVIGSNVSHSIANPDGPLCLLYLEKTSNNYRSILEHHSVASEGQTRREPLILNQPVSQNIREQLLQAMSSKIDQNRANDLKKLCLKLFNSYIADAQSIDPRIGKLLNFLHGQSGNQFSGFELADIVCLSESRMQHLFKQHMGIPIRRYILWMRLRNVLERVLTGIPITAAAHDSGFSDSAHYSRTFKAMYGIAPSSLLSADAGLEPLFCEND